MQIYENTQSTEKPQAFKISELMVDICKNINENESGYKFTLIRYTKDEYIEILQKQITDTELALAEIYEEVFAGG